MIQSTFILSSTGEVLIERHFRDAPVSRSVCDYFWEKAAKGVNHHGGLSTTTSLLTNEEQQLLLPLDVLPVMEVPETNHGTVYIISILRDGLSYLAAVPTEVNPLMILEFLHRVADVFVDYFGNPADESAVKENFSTVYQLLEEMVDYGWPLTTEPNALKAMIRPPSILTQLSSAVFVNNNVSHALPSGTISNMPWRASGVTHTQNEIYMDVIEEIDAIIDAASGNVVQSDVSGRIQCDCRLSGIPDLLLSFKDPKLIDDCSFHPCVRYGRFEREKIVSFVPPDGNFELMRYSISADRKANFSPPLECHSQWNIFKPQSNNNGDGTTTTTEVEYSARFMVTVRIRSLSSLVKSASRNTKVRMEAEDVAVTIPFPKAVRSASFQVSTGKIIYDEAGKIAKWMLGKMVDDPTVPRVQLVANLKMKSSKKQSKQKHKYPSADISDSEDEAGKEDETRSPNVSLHWKIPLTSVSGLSVSGLSITGESYQPYKGVRNVTKSGLYQVRYS
mmetsp:Transcript_16741/g.38276  ORF Transcript_16741/g.38276 Transcript_16741/m.38276 type:complete len:504 (-) Transcript_16741:430-1941(-)|eukprot:CAMPEP_0201133206 /NCGR_PEP_ID=MMETSP0850-20130426/48126_1 /ASSEMBLY_ACC=CAM_ASM_000622 /TAXON_ID=183588 /ORGANISM="Pseudo-nitzschia fraudulenta, Strain WWA7" /LENGTH=503 /DNA_ID=CAMNT_0047403777 /DNA_START=98 /DNA_END=1609 /DNA_ORIENTATION=-